MAGGAWRAWPDAARPPMSRRAGVARGLVGLGVGLVLAGLGTEVAFRAVSFTPRVQIVRDGVGSRTTTVMDGVVLWDEGPSDLVDRNEACPEDGTVNLLLAGDSVFRVTHPDGRDNSLDGILESRLRRDHPGLCVVNVSESGYIPEQVFAEIRRAHSRFRVDALVVGVFKDAGHYARFGDAWIEVNGYALDATGAPRLPWFPGGALNALLFERSRAFQYATLTMGALRDDPDPLRDYRAIAAWAEARAIPMLLVDLPWLSAPFAESAASPRHTLAPWGAPVVDVARELSGDDVAALRTDLCCHYNAAGHARLADVIEPRVRALLARPADQGAAVASPVTR